MLSTLHGLQNTVNLLLLLNTFNLVTHFYGASFYNFDQLCVGLEMSILSSKPHGIFSV